MNCTKAIELDILSLLQPCAYDHPVKNIELIETHISWVILTGDFAYKIKKPVAFGFLDFSTLEKRRVCCEQEVSLNRRLAPDIYLNVISITGSQKKPVISGNGEVFEYAVKMAQFPQSGQLDNMLAAGELSVGHMDEVARLVADFHQSIQIADDALEYGNNELVSQPVEENFIQINEHLGIRRYVDTLNMLQEFSESEFTKLESVFEQRKRDGFIRECHGDMHLRNMVWLDNGPTAFDCIEFNSNLRWIDVMSEIAFLVMDLHARKSHQLGNRFLNTYLEATGDYSGLAVLSFYLGYRALVRAKVSVLRLEQKKFSDDVNNESLIEFVSYLKLATSYTQQPTQKLIIMRGVSASGKSTVSQQLVDELGMVRIRSDIERKRLFDIPLLENSSGGIDSGIYSAESSQKTYAKLLELASDILRAGYSVIVDAVFVKHEHRLPFQTLAETLALPYVIVETNAPEHVLKQRILERKNDASDANLEVLEHQLDNWPSLSDSERDSVISVDTDRSNNIEFVFSKLT